MRRALVLLVMVGCGTTVTSSLSVVDEDSGVGSGTRPDASIVDAPLLPSDAGDETDSLDAAADVVDAGPPFGQTCTPHVTKCPTATHPSGASAPQVCWDQLSVMYGKCTFYCYRINNNQVEPDPTTAQLCSVLGGTCTPWKQDGLPICVLN